MNKQILCSATEKVERSLRIYTDLSDNDVQRMVKQITHAIDWEDPVFLYERQEDLIQRYTCGDEQD